MGGTRRLFLEQRLAREEAHKRTADEARQQLARVERRAPTSNVQRVHNPVFFFLIFFAFAVSFVLTASSPFRQTTVAVAVAVAVAGVVTTVDAQAMQQSVEGDALVEDIAVCDSHAHLVRSVCSDDVEHVDKPVGLETKRHGRVRQLARHHQLVARVVERLGLAHVHSLTHKVNSKGQPDRVRLVEGELVASLEVHRSRTRSARNSKSTLTCTRRVVVAG